MPSGLKLDRAVHLIGLMRLFRLLLWAWAFRMPVLDGQGLESVPTNASTAPWPSSDKVPQLADDPTGTNESSANGSLPLPEEDDEADNETDNVTSDESEYLVDMGSEHLREKLRLLILPIDRRRRSVGIGGIRRRISGVSPRRRSLPIPSPRRRSLPIPSARRRSLPIPSPRRRSLPIPSPRRRGPPTFPSFRRRADLIRRRINDPTRRRRSFQDMQRRRGVDLPTDLQRRRRTIDRRRRTVDVRRRQPPVCKQWVTCKNFYYKGVYCGPDNRLCLHWQ